MIIGFCIGAREVSAATALITAREPEHEIIGSSAPDRGGYGGMHGGGEPGITRVNLSPRMRLTEVIKRIESIPMGAQFRRAVEFGLSVKRETASVFKPRTIGQLMDSHLASCPSFFLGWAAVFWLSNWVAQLR